MIQDELRFSLKFFKKQKAEMEGRKKKKVLCFQAKLNLWLVPLSSGAEWT
jgi:hypothetical protein